MRNEDGFVIFVFGVAFAFVLFFMAWQIGESACEEKHNVYDCEWARTPFQPATPTPDKQA